MCLLIFKPAGKSIPLEHLQNAYQSNSDGSGIAIARNNKIVIEKSAKWTDEEIHKVLEKNVDYPAIIHFRYATHGSKNFHNTHPFSLNEKWVAAHNGVIPGVQRDFKNDESDTRAFLRQHVIPLLNCQVRLDDRDVLTMLGKSMTSSNKMVFLCADGSHGIANEEAGHWNKDGIWYSNNTYQSGFLPVRKYISTGFKYPASYYENDDNHYMSQMSEYNRQMRMQHGDENFDDDDEDCISPFKPKTSIDSEKSKKLEELWHTFDLTSLYCDSCSRRVIGEFYVEGQGGLLYCHQCRHEI